MALLRWQRNIVDEAGNTQAGAEVEIRSETTGALAALFEDRAGTVPKGNPITADSNGYAFAYTAPDRFKITASNGAFSATWRDVWLPNDYAELSGRINKRTIYVGSVAELEALPLAEGVSVYLTEADRAGPGVIKSGTPPSDPLKGRYITLSNGNYWERTMFNEALASWWGALPETDITAAVKAAQSALASEGGGRLIINVDGWASIADLTVDATYSDYAIDVASNIEITAIPGFELRADKTKGADAGGYCVFRIFEGVENVKIHGFHDINGIDRNTVKGIGQVVAIRGNDTLNPARNIDVWDMEYREIRDEPFRLGQTNVNGQIAENVNIWDIRGDGSISHGVVMRSILNGHASALRIKNAGRLGIDISSYCVNCHLDGSRGENRFINTVGGAKIDGGAITVDCSLSDYYYDGDVDGLASTDGYAFRLRGLRGKVKNVKAFNCGGVGFNMNGVSPGDNNELESIYIDSVADNGSSTFPGLGFSIRNQTADASSIGLKMKGVVINGAQARSRIFASGVDGDITFVGPTNGLDLYDSLDGLAITDLNLSLTYDSVDAASFDVNETVNIDNISIDIESCTGGGNPTLRVSGGKSIKINKADNVNVGGTFITFDGTQDPFVTNVTGAADRLVRFQGAIRSILCANIVGDCATSLVSQSSSSTVTKGLVANTVAINQGNDILGAGITQANNL